MVVLTPDTTVQSVTGLMFESYSQCFLDLSEGLLCLVEKAKHDRVAELAVAGLIHLQNLLEGDHVDVITEVDLVDGLALRLTAISDHVRADAQPV